MASSAGKPYYDYKFLGIRSFVELLDEAAKDYSMITDSSIENLYQGEASFLNRKDDTVRMGKVPKDGEDVFFLEFGLMIAPQVGARAYIVFIFDHCPTAEQMEQTAADIESLVNSRLEDYGKTMPAAKGDSPGGGTIN